MPLNQVANITVQGGTMLLVTPFDPTNIGNITAGIRGIFEDSDYRILQWETTLTQGGFPIDKEGPNLRCTPEAVSFAQSLGIDLALCANNHFADYGDDVVLETLQHLNDAGIATIGAGQDLPTADTPLVVDFQGTRIAFFNWCEHEFGIATKDRPGMAPQRPYENAHALRNCDADIKIALLHGGHEFYPFPSPRVQTLMRSLSEAGASAVWNCHTHCPSGWESYKGAVLTFSPGNFYFPAREESLPSWSLGHLVRYYCDEQGIFAYGIIPYRFTLQSISPLEQNTAEQYFAYLEKINAVIANPEKLQAYFEAWCTKAGSGYLNAINQFDTDPEWPPLQNEPAHFHRWKHVRNLFLCEAHNNLCRQLLTLLEYGRFAEANTLLPEVLAFQNLDGIR
ncbi:MAG: CapA family protein [Victivallales bacterium]|nr:CapA family protein [Victivallales bacterium]